jgi:ankyrin repeat protein
MAFNCTQAVAVDPEILQRAHSAFGDNYSVKSRSTGSYSLARYQDEPEADYDEGATDLYRRIENKDWDGALSRLEMAPVEAKTWVSRREYGSEKTRWRLLPLHAVCIFRAPLALIEALIEVYSDGPKMKDDQGMLPVHLACRNGASKGVVLTLLSAFPESVHVRDRKGRTPVDLVRSSNSANKEAVLEAIKRFQRDVADPEIGHEEPHSTPQATSSKLGGSTPKTVASAIKKDDDAAPEPVLEVDYEHRTVLFRLILKKEWKHAAVRAASYPEEASTWIVTKGFHGNLRFLPIHKACVLSPPFSLIDALLEAHPDGAKAKDQDGWLPIHCACFYGASDEVVTSLLKPFPKGAQSKDDEGRLPLHYACLKGASQGVVDSLLDAFAKGSMSKDDEGRLPIHHACGKGAPEGVIDALLKVSPKGAQSKDDQGRLALHHACRKNASERVIRTLLRVYPRATQIKDDQDKLPIHYACQNGASVHVVSLLLSTYPESVNVQNGFGNTPLAEAKSTDNPKMEAVVRVLEKAKKEQDKIKVESGETAELSTKLSVLQEKVDSLERTLNKVFVMGKEMRHDLVRRGKDPGDVLEKFADRLIELSGSGSSGSKSKDKTPLKARQATPVKGLFSGLVGGGKNGSSSKEKASAKQ